ncbi:MAG: imidazoleglycerol-phosphate dehydratase HisB [Pseudomonadota bacterium]
MARYAEKKRATTETDIYIKLNIDGKGNTAISSGVGFLDHMLTLMAAHGFLDLEVRATGDITVDDHHTVEDIGIVLGDVLRDAIGDKSGIRRYGSCIVPMDDALALVAIDISNRPYLVYNVPIKQDRVGSLDVRLIKEFFRAFVNHCGMTLHINVFYGDNMHHIIEGVFKAFGQALNEAVAYDQRIERVRSTKGVL